MNTALTALLLQTLIHTTGPAAPAAPATVEQNGKAESRVYFADRNAQEDVENALASAKASGKTVVVIMGANWCHDSIGLAGRLGSPRFTQMMRDKYAIIYVDSGTPQTGNGRNLDIAKRFGIKKVKSTPLVMLISADGTLLNSKKDAASWRNAANRSDDEIYRYFNAFGVAPD